MNLHHASDIKKSILFIYLKDENGSRKAIGTGFLILVDVENRNDAYLVYLISAKHVLVNKEGIFPQFEIRLNRRDGSSSYVEIRSKEIVSFFHQDSTVDIIAIPITQYFPIDYPKVFDFKSISSKMIITKEKMNGNLFLFFDIFLYHHSTQYSKKLSFMYSFYNNFLDFYNIKNL